MEYTIGMLTIIAILLFILVLPSIIELAAILPFFLLAAVLWAFAAIGQVILIPFKILNFIMDGVNVAIKWLRDVLGITKLVKLYNKKFNTNY